MDFETDKVAGRLPCPAYLDNFHHHDVLVANKGFFHIQVGIADGPYTDKRVFLKCICMERDENCLTMIDQRFAVGKEGEDGVGLAYSVKR